MIYGMYIINSVYGPEPRSSGGNTSSNPQVSVSQSSLTKISWEINYLNFIQISRDKKVYISLLLLWRLPFQLLLLKWLCKYGWLNWSHGCPRCDLHTLIINWNHIDESTSEIQTYRKVSNIRRAKYQNLNDSRLVLQLYVPNPLKPSVKSIMKT